MEWRDFIYLRQNKNFIMQFTYDCCDYTCIKFLKYSSEVPPLTWKEKRLWSSIFLSIFNTMNLNNVLRDLHYFTLLPRHATWKNNERNRHKIISFLPNITYMCVLMSLREVYINLLIEILVLLKSLLEHYSLSGLKI